ncbi:hypothetical protein, partial [Shewanella denitrificans]|uniref:hypothetical protein n=1 Tax=Shewanella denitrificans TaxID=192073 RepID=UPI0039EF5A57
YRRSVIYSSTHVNTYMDTSLNSSDIIEQQWVKLHTYIRPVYEKVLFSGPNEYRAFVAYRPYGFIRSRVLSQHWQRPVLPVTSLHFIASLDVLLLNSF